MEGENPEGRSVAFVIDESDGSMFVDVQEPDESGTEWTEACIVLPRPLTEAEQGVVLEILLKCEREDVDVILSLLESGRLPLNPAENVK